eukprot:286674-Chlamydomonas_euryale.AAC.2
MVGIFGTQRHASTLRPSSECNASNAPSQLTLRCFRSPARSSAPMAGVFGTRRHAPTLRPNNECNASNVPSQLTLRCLRSPARSNAPMVGALEVDA